MKILFITDNFPPEVNAPATRTYEHVVEWTKLGAEVTVITCNPNFPQGKLFEGYKNTFKNVEWMDGIRVIRVWSYMTANEGFLKRTLDYLSFAITSTLNGLFESPDVIVATSPQFFTTWTGRILSLLKQKPWVFELRDMWPESIVSVGALKQSSLIYKMLERIELYLYRSADLIVPNTPAFKENLIQRNISEHKIKVVPNGANLDLFNPAKVSGDTVKKMLGLDGKFVVGYIGTHGLAHSLNFIIKTISEYRFSGIHFLFIGDGAEKKNIIQLADEAKLENVTFLAPVPKDQIPRYLAAIDVSLAPLKRSETFKSVIPSKIFEAAAMGKPVLLGVEGQAKEIVDSYHSGLCFEPENRTSFAKALTRVHSDRDLYNQLSENSKILAKDYDRSKLAKEMLDYITILCNN